MTKEILGLAHRTPPPPCAYISRPRSAPLSPSSVSVPSQGTGGLATIIPGDPSHRGRGRLLLPPDPQSVAVVVRRGSWSLVISLIRHEIIRVRRNSSSLSLGTTWPSCAVASPSATTSSGKQRAIRFAMCYISCRNVRYSSLCVSKPRGCLSAWTSL
jgi:hypothetical protein